MAFEQPPKNVTTENRSNKPKDPNRQGLGNAVGDLLGFDPTPGFNIPNPFASNPTPQSSNPQPQKAVTSPPVLGTETQVQLGGYSTNAGGASNQDAQLARLQIEQGLASANDAQSRLDSQLGIGLGNIARDYESAFGRLTGQRQSAMRDNQTAVNNQLSEYDNTRAANNQNARNLLFGARRLLGQAGAGGGSADMFAAPLAAQNEGNNANATAQNVSNRNLAALTSAREDNERNFENSFADLGAQRQNSENAYRSSVEQQRADILNQIATLRGQQAIAQGGNYQQALAVARPITDRVSGLLNTINGLSARTAALNPQNVNLARPDLAQYGVTRYDAPAVAQQDPSLYTPATRTLFGLDEREQIAV